MNVLDWVIIGLGVVAIGLYAFLKFREFYNDKKEFEERKANGEDVEHIKADMQNRKGKNKQKKAEKTDDKPYEE